MLLVAEAAELALAVPGLHSLDCDDLRGVLGASSEAAALCEPEYDNDEEGQSYTSQHLFRDVGQVLEGRSWAVAEDGPNWDTINALRHLVETCGRIASGRAQVAAEPAHGED